MEVIRALDEVCLSHPSQVTIGAFDGVHRGHRHLIGKMVVAAHKKDQAAVTLTFDPHPGAVLGRRPVAVLSSIEERAELLSEIGVDFLVVLNFNAAVAGMSAERFVLRLMRDLRMVDLWAGPDFALGHRREGDVYSLQRLGTEVGFQVHVIEPLRWRGEVVSSTRIREALTAGDLEEANGCLGRPYRLVGSVVPGRGVGHSLGVPTANLDLPEGRLVPANGVYACWVHTEHEGTRPAVVNVGVRPTIATGELTIEAHLLDFEGDLYGQRLRLDFVARLRDEAVFHSLNALVEQIERDIERTRRVLISGTPEGVDR